MLGSLLRSPKCRQIGQIGINLSVDGSQGVPVASGPDAPIVLSVVKVSAGIHTITFKESAKMNLHVDSIVSLTDGAVFAASAVTKNSVTIKSVDSVLGTVVDADFNISIIWMDQLSYTF